MPVRVQVILLILLLAAAGRGEDKPHPLAGQINAALEQMDRAKATIGAWEDYQRLEDFGKADLKAAQAAMAEEAEAWRQLADACQRQDKPAMERLQAETQRLMKVGQRWAQRLDARSNQQAYVMDERGATWGAYLRSDALAPLARQWIAARRAACDAWGAYAEALVPDAPQDRLDALFDQAQRAVAEAQIMDMRWTWTNEVARFSADPAISSPELQARLTQYWQSRERFIVLRRQQLELEQQRREADRQQHQVMPQLQKAYEAAVKAKQEADRKAQAK